MPYSPLRILAGLSLMGIMGTIVMAMCVYIVLQDVSKVDDSWEQVTLQQYLAGETENTALFEVDGFRGGDQYWVQQERYSDDFTAVYIPLYQAGQADDDGTSVKVVAVFYDVANERELAKALAARTVKIQDYRRSSIPNHVRSLSNLYPKIDWNTVSWVVVDEDVRSEDDVWEIIWLGCGFAVLAVGSCSFWGILWRRQRSAKRESLGVLLN